jgi:hypothetical protein
MYQEFRTGNQCVFPLFFFSLQEGMMYYGAKGQTFFVDVELTLGDGY